MICPKCQTQNQEGTSFCIKCGSPLIAPVMPSMAVSTQAAVSSPSRNLLKPLIIIGMILLLGIGGVIFAVSLLGQSKTPEETPPASVINMTPLASPQAPEAGLAKDKYEIDSNGDGIPDFVETALGWDPTKDACQEKLCGDSDISQRSKKPKNILFILDSSGSMAEIVSGEQKMTAAKRVLKEYVNSLPSGINLGLMVYGHKGSNSTSDKAVSCVGIDVLYSLGPADKQKFSSAVDSFQPTGWTPIGGSLRKAKNEAFAGHDGENNYIVVITDGIETCDSDPIGAVNELRNSGIQPTVNVIGFAVGSSDQAQLQQIASQGGGKYFTVNNALEMANVLNDIRNEMEGVTYDIRCLQNSFSEYVKCAQDRLLAAVKYLGDIRNQAFKSGNSVEGTKANDSIININKRTVEITTLTNQQSQLNESEKISKLQELLKQQREQVR